ncbi:MAG: T9SS type A sorting domain-containing protein [Bacteroidetes bacterium]|nr:T9SS type A sorting domain-containing protein [Bacteroidota bacterium]
MNFNRNHLNSLIILFCIIFKQDYAQSFIQAGDTNFAQIAARNASLTVDTSWESPYFKYKRFESFIAPRLAPSGSLKNMTNAYKQYYNSVNTSAYSLSSNSSVFGNWQDLGPNNINLPGYQMGLGQVNRIQVDYDDISGNTIYIASHMGGIFKTTDGGANWTNLYTDYAFSTNVVSDIKLIKDPITLKKYLYAAIGGQWLSAGGTPFYGICRIEIGTNSWQNLTGNLTCPSMLETTLESAVNKILINPNNLNKIYLATTKGVFYTCNAGCVPPILNCITPGTTWKKSNITTDVWGIDFDYSDLTYNSIYCSKNQIWHTSNIDVNGFSSITNVANLNFTDKVFDNYTNLPTGVITTLSSSSNLNINIATSPSYPNKLYFLLSTGGGYNPENSFFMEYDKTIPNSSFPNNFILKTTQSTAFHAERNYIHFSPYNPNLIAYSYSPIYNSGVQVYDLTTNSINNTYNVSYQNHGDGHDFAFVPNNIITLTDGGPIKINTTSSLYGYITGNGLGVAEISGFDVNEKSGTEAVMGLQDDGTKITSSLNMTNDWAFLLNSFGDGAAPRYFTNGDYLWGFPGGNYKVMAASTSANIMTPPTIGVYNNASNFYPDLQVTNGSPNFYRAIKELVYNKGNYSPNYTDVAYVLSNFDIYRNSLLCPYGAVTTFASTEDNKTIYLIDDYREYWTPSPCDKNTFNVLWKTTFGGINHPDVSSPCTSNCWTQLGNQSSLALIGKPSAICLNPSNSNELWVGAGGYYDVSIPNNNRRIIHSIDGGNTWVDFSLGLPSLPVSKIICRKGTNYELYVATDVGVYYRTSSMNSWQPVSTNLPHTMVFDLKIDNCNNRLYAGTYGRGLWGIDLPTTTNPGAMPSITINNNKTYNTPQYFLTDIIVPAGVKLTISNTNVKMGAGTSIIVQPGGRLDILNSTIEGYCDKNMWKHILAEGISNLPQTYNSGTGFYPNHGYVFINNSTIKDAGQAAVTAENGGVVYANASNFINNRKGLEFHIYNYVNNQSKAVSCVFETNANLKDPNQTIDSHVTAWAVDGIKFFGCTFKNTAPAGSNGNNLGNGVYSIDAFYTIDNACGGCGTQPATTGRSLFYNLNYGVYAQTGVSSLKTLNIINADFNLCSRGAYIKTIDFAKVQYCNFTNIVPEPIFTLINLPYYNSTYGLYFDNCQNYFCENNSFKGTRTPGLNVGLIVNNANANATRAYYCDFTNLKVASAAYYDNYGAGVGLKFNCNKYSANGYDVGILGITPTTDIDNVQGFYNVSNPNPQNLVRNLYSATCASGANNQWYNDGTSGSLIQHSNHSTQSGNGGTFFTAPQVGCYDNSKLAVNPIPSQNLVRTTDCPITGTGNTCPTCNRISLSEGISANKQNLAIAQAALAAGASATSLNAINSNMSNGNLKNLLEQNSPYLSDAILIAYFSSNNTPNGHAKDIHALNAPVSASVWQTIVNHGYPNGIFNQMQAAQNTGATSGRTNQENLIGNIKSEIDYLYNHKLRLFMGDSTNINTDSLKANIIASTYTDKAQKLTDFYINTKQYALAIEALTPIEFNPTYTDYVAFKKDVIAALQTTLGIFSIKQNAQVKDKVLRLAASNLVYGQQQAQGLANFLFGNKYNEPTLLPNGSGGNRIAYTVIDSTKTIADNTFKTINYLSAVPNPATNQVSIHYKLPNNELTGTIQIIDVAGKIMATYDVITSLTHIDLNISDWANGVYFYNLRVNKVVVDTKKIIIIK